MVSFAVLSKAAAVIWLFDLYLPAELALEDARDLLDVLLSFPSTFCVLVLGCGSSPTPMTFSISTDLSILATMLLINGENAKRKLG